MIKGSKGNLTIYIGNKKVKEGYLGNIKVYPNSFLEVTQSLHSDAVGSSQQLVINCIDDQKWSIIAPNTINVVIDKLSGMGPTTVNVVFPNNKSTDALSGVIRIESVDELSAECYLDQDAGVQTDDYTQWVDKSISCIADTPTIPNTGGTSTINVTSHQERYHNFYWNGILDEQELENQDVVVNDLAVFMIAGGDAIATDNIVTAPSNRTPDENRITVDISYKTFRDVLYITQSAGIEILRNLVIHSHIWNSVTAGGGVSNPTLTYTAEHLWNGEEDTVEIINSGAIITYKDAATNDSIVAPLNVPSLGTTVTDSNSLYKTIVATVVLGSLSETSEAEVIQGANNITSAQNPTGLSLSVGIIPASGGTISSGNVTGTASQNVTLASGATTTITPSISNSYYSNSVTAGSKGTTDSNITNVGTLTYYYTANGKTGSASATVTQAANHIKATTVNRVEWDFGFIYGGVMGGANDHCVIGAGGGSYNFIKSATAYVVHTYDSGQSTGENTVNISNTITVNQTQSAPLIAWNQTNVSASSRGHTAGSQQNSRYRATATYNGQSFTSGIVNVYLESNNPVYVSYTCRGTTKVSTYRWPSDNSTYTSNSTKSPDCGYYTNLTVNAVIHGGGCVKQCHYNVGNTPRSVFRELTTTYKETSPGEAYQFNQKQSDAQEYYTGGPSIYSYGNSDYGEWQLGGQPWISVSDKSGPLGVFKIDYDLAPDPIDGIECQFNHVFYTR